MGWGAARQRRSRLAALRTFGLALVCTAVLFVVSPAQHPAGELALLLGRRLTAAPAATSLHGKPPRHVAQSGLFIYTPSLSPSGGSAAVVYTLFGGDKLSAKGQRDTFASIKQVRALNPDILIYLVLQRKDLAKMASEKFLSQAVQLQVHVLAHDSSLLPGSKEILLDAVRGLYPDRDPNLIAIERMVAVSDIAAALELHDFFHIESDQMVYVNLAEHVQALRSCNIDLALPVVVQNITTLSFVYFHDASAARDFADFVLGALDSPSDRNLGKVSLAREYVAKYHESGGMVVEALPTLLRGGEDKNCLRDSYVYDILFDASRKVAAAQLEWRQCEHSNQLLLCPWMGALRVVNMHVHSKQLHRFSSRLSLNELPTQWYL